MRNGVSIALGLLLLAVVPGRADQTMTFNWEDGVSTALGTYNNVVVENTGDLAQSGSRSLKCTKTPNTGSTPQVWVWWITGCLDGDVINASFYVYDVTPGTNPSARIWAHYTSDPNNINSYSGSASGPSTYSSGIGWEQMSGAWTFANSGDDDGIVIELRIYASSGSDSVIYVDNAFISTTSNTAVIHNAAGAVPVELTSFAASPGQGEVTLTWSTASESDNMGFYVFRSIGASARVLLTPELIPGAGTTLVPQTYRYVDRDVTPSVTYRYWLEQVDFQGTSQLYGPVTLTVPDDLEGFVLHVTPQPVRSHADIRFKVPAEGPAEVAVYDVQGRMVAKVWQGAASGTHTVRWDCAGVPSGLYMVRVASDRGSVQHPIVLR